MKKIKVINLPSAIKSIRLTEVDELTLDIETSEYWSRDTEKEYNAVTKQLDKITEKGKGYNIYVWYDVSGFDYWVKTMQEDNYAQITISFDNAEINPAQIPAIERKLQRVIDKVENVTIINHFKTCKHVTIKFK